MGHACRLGIRRPPANVRWKGRDVTTGFFKDPVDARIPLRRLNLEGDGQADLSVHGGAAKAVYAYRLEHYPLWREQLGQDLPFGTFGENLTVEGLPLEEEAAVGDRFRIGTAELVVTQPRLPCLAVEVEGGVAAGDGVETIARHSARTR